MRTTVVKALRQLSRCIFPVLGICFLCGFMVRTPPGEKHLQILPLPPEHSPSGEDLFAYHGSRSFFFFNPRKSTDLWELSLYRPMGSPDYLEESWNRIPLPELRSMHRIQDMAYARGMIFLAGLDENGTPIVRSYLLSPEKQDISPARVVAHTDFYPPSGGSPVRKMYYDLRTRVLWLLYDNGQVQIGPHILPLPRTLLTDSPAGYLMLPGRKKNASGPRLLPRVRKMPQDTSCLSCPLSIFLRQRSNEEEIVDHPVHLPGRIRTHMGLWPLGQRTALFRDHESYACHIPDKDFPRRLHPCLRIPRTDLPMSTLLTGTWLVLLTGPDEQSRRHLLTLNAAYVDNRIRQGAPITSGFLRQLVQKNGTDYPLPSRSRLDGNFAVSTSRQAIFIGRHYLYRIFLYKNTRSALASSPKKHMFEP